MGPISSMYSVILISPHQAKSTSPLTPPILQLLANLFYLWNQPPAHAKRGSRVRLYPLPLFLAPYSGSLTMSSNCRNVKEIRSVPLQPQKSKSIPTQTTFRMSPLLDEASSSDEDGPTSALPSGVKDCSVEENHGSDHASEWLRRLRYSVPGHCLHVDLFYSTMSTLKKEKEKVAHVHYSLGSRRGNVWMALIPRPSSFSYSILAISHVCCLF